MVWQVLVVLSSENVVLDWRLKIIKWFSVWNVTATLTRTTLLCSALLSNVSQTRPGIQIWSWLIDWNFPPGRNSVDTYIYKCARVWCLWESGREGVSTLTVQSWSDWTTPSPAIRPSWQPSSALVCKHNKHNKPDHQTFTFCLETLFLPSEPAALSDYREVMEQNIFKVVFPQLAWDDVMGPAVRTGEENSELHTKITYLSTDLTPIELFSSMKIKG